MYLIFPSDPTTEFLQEVIDESIQNFPEIKLIQCGATKKSYDDTIATLNKIPKGGIVFFIGHGSPNSLYGGATSEIDKKPILTLNNINLFKDFKLILMACNSASFLKSSREMRGFSDGLGFGLLPSEMGELQVNRKIRELELTEGDLEQFKKILIDLFKKVIAKVARGEKSIESLANFVSTYICSLINNLVINENETKVAKLLYYVKKELLSG